MSKLRRPFSYDRYIFVALDSLTEYTGVDAAEPEKQRGLAIDRARWPQSLGSRSLAGYLSQSFPREAL
jgi:hypothetical protein